MAYKDMDDIKTKNPFNSIFPRPFNRKQSAGLHLIVCPFCDNGHPIPTDFDSIHRCTCGACFKICGSDTLENGVGDIATSLWNDEELSFVRSVPIDFCNIVIEKDFDRLLDLKHASRDLSGIERFCKYDTNLNLSLVWVKRLF